MSVSGQFGIDTSFTFVLMYDWILFRSGWIVSLAVTQLARYASVSLNSFR